MHCHLHLPLGPPVPVLLDGEPEPGLDLLLHGDPHLLLSGPHRHVHHLGQGHSLSCHLWGGWRLPGRYGQLVVLRQHLSWGFVNLNICQGKVLTKHLIRKCRISHFWSRPLRSVKLIL